MTSAKIANQAITAGKIASGAINGTHLAPASLNSSHFTVPIAPGIGQVLGFDGTGLNWTAPGGIFALNGTSAYYNGGNIGIGTALPPRKLSVVSGSVNDGLYLEGAGTMFLMKSVQNGHVFAINISGAGAPAFYESPDGNNYSLDLGFYNGNVGIGTSAASQQLSLTGGIGFANQNALDKKLYSPTDGTLEWMTHDLAGVHGFAVSHQGDQRVFLNTLGNSFLNGGNVGIGTTAPAEKLHIDGNLRLGLDANARHISSPWRLLIHSDNEYLYLNPFAGSGSVIVGGGWSWTFVGYWYNHHESSGNHRWRRHRGAIRCSGRQHPSWFSGSDRRSKSR